MLYIKKNNNILINNILSTITLMLIKSAGRINNMVVATKVECHEYYGNLQGLRVISCLAIIAMHIQANTDYKITGMLYKFIVPSWSSFVYMFLAISGFGMFCGYYELFKLNTIDLNNFYSKRYKKILPFFTFLILIDIVVNHSVSSVIEGLMELTLTYGLLPNNELDVIGVAWTLGVIFLFYMLFPFIVYLCWTKRRAWLSFMASIIITWFCSEYFFSEKFVVAEYSFRHNFLYCVPFFIGGGLVYLFRHKIIKTMQKHKVGTLLFCILTTIIYYMMPAQLGEHFPLTVINNIILSLLWLSYAISVNIRILNNKVTDFLGKISLEFYLAHMVVFRGIEKMGLIDMIGEGWSGFIMTWILVIVGLIFFITSYKFVVNQICKIVKNTRILK